jgi:hypothetical protein
VEESWVDINRWEMLVWDCTHYGLYYVTMEKENLWKDDKQFPEGKGAQNIV